MDIFLTKVYKTRQTILGRHNQGGHFLNRHILERHILDRRMNKILSSFAIEKVKLTLSPSKVKADKLVLFKFNFRKLFKAEIKTGRQ